MRIRKPISKLITGALILSLVMVGTVPAKKSCEGACGCCEKSKNQSEDFAIHSTESRRIQYFDNILGIFHQEHRIASVQETVQKASGCHQGNATVPCDMEPLPAPEALKGVVQSIFRGEHSPLDASAFGSSTLAVNPHPFAGLTTRHLMPARAAPSQLYLQKSSFLC